MVGRDAFAAPHYTTSTAKGWLTIDTGSMTLRYRVGSGAFTADNLTVRLTAGRQREQLLPYTYSAARTATATGTPIVRPLYLTYPGEQEAYADAGAEYLYGPDMLVAPVTTPGTSATTSVWFPPGTTWTDYFTGTTYQGGTTAQITTTLDTMPVFVRAGAAVHPAGR